MSEPTAGAMAYGLFVAGQKTVCVFDLGGGTFDTSLLKINEGNVEVLATHGDNRVGGSDIDKLVMGYVLEQVLQWKIRQRRNRTSSPLRKYSNLLNTESVAQNIDVIRLRKDCEAAKVRLSTQQITQIAVYPRIRKSDNKRSDTDAEVVTTDNNEEEKQSFVQDLKKLHNCETSKHFDSSRISFEGKTHSNRDPESALLIVDLTQKKLQTLCIKLFDACMCSIDDCLTEAKIQATEVDEVSPSHSCHYA